VLRPKKDAPYPHSQNSTKDEKWNKLLPPSKRILLGRILPDSAHRTLRDSIRVGAAQRRLSKRDSFGRWRKGPRAIC